MAAMPSADGSDGSDDRSRGLAGQWQNGDGWRDERGVGWSDDRGWQQGQEHRSRGREGQWQNGDGWRGERGVGWSDDRGRQQGQENRSRGREDQQGSGKGSRDDLGWGQGQDDRSPAVAAPGVSSEAGAPQSRAQVYDLEYVRNLPLTTHYKEHNVALKFVREVCAREGNTFLWFSNTDPFYVAEIHHPKGTAFTFDETVRKKPWRWQDMVAQLDEASMRLVVEGGPVCSLGIIACALQQTQVYDHKRHHAEVQNGTAVAGTKHFIWDFVLIRDDNTYTALHPNFANTKVECKVHIRPDGELPATGLGGTSGRGTFQHFLKKDVDCVLRFDAGKKVTRAVAVSAGQGQGQVTPAGQGQGQVTPAVSVSAGQGQIQVTPAVAAALWQ